MAYNPFVRRLLRFFGIAIVAINWSYDPADRRLCLTAESDGLDATLRRMGCRSKATWNGSAGITFDEPTQSYMLFSVSSTVGNSYVQTILECCVPTAYSRLRAIQKINTKIKMWHRDPASQDRCYDDNVMQFLVRQRRMQWMVQKHFGDMPHAA